jgi:hypothetical protein
LGKKGKKAPDKRSEGQREADKDTALNSAVALLEGDHTPKQVKQQLPAMKAKHRLSKLRLVKEGKRERKIAYHFEAAASAPKNSKVVLKGSASKYVEECKACPQGLRIKEDYTKRMAWQPGLRGVPGIRHWFYPSSFRKSVRADILKETKQKDGLYLCPGTSGQDPHYVSASKMDLDHTISVSELWNSGGNNKAQDSRYKDYNDLAHLAALCKSCNRGKGGEPYNPCVGPDFSGWKGE